MAGCGAEYLVMTSSMLKLFLEDPALVDKYVADLDSVGLSFLDSHAPFGADWDLNCFCEERHAELIELHKKSMRIAANAGVRTMTFHIGNDFIQPEIPESAHLERVCRMLDVLLAEAEKLHMTLAIENSWTKFAAVDNLLKIKALYPVKELGFCFDSGHANIMDNGRLYPDSPAYETWNPMNIKVPQWEDCTLEKLLDNVTVCHLHDNNGSADQHDLPGRGNVDWDKIIKLLEKAPRLMAIQSETSMERNNISPQQLVGTFRQMFEC